MIKQQNRSMNLHRIGLGMYVVKQYIWSRKKGKGNNKGNKVLGKIYKANVIIEQRLKVVTVLQGLTKDILCTIKSSTCSLHLCSTNLKTINQNKKVISDFAQLLIHMMHRVKILYLL